MSENLRTNIKGYHVNDEKRCLKFIEEDDYIITSQDVYWLGFGMYFWDNNSNANYWIKQKVKKNPSETYIKVSANIYTDEELLLDLASPEVTKQLQILWELYCNKKNELKEQPLGIKIDKIFNFFDDVFKDIKVVRGIGNYDINGKSMSGFTKFKRYNGPQISKNLKNIYCIRTHDIVVNRKVQEELRI